MTNSLIIIQFLLELTLKAQICCDGKIPDDGSWEWFFFLKWRKKNFWPVVKLPAMYPYKRNVNILTSSDSGQMISPLNT